VGGAYRKPGSPVKSQSALPAVWRGQLAVPMRDRPGRQGAYKASGEARRPQAATQGLEVEVGGRVSPRYLALSSSPVWLPNEGESGHWEESLSLERTCIVGLEESVGRS
jgi:hypothetical protein